MTDTRGDMLADLAAAVNELTEIRHHVEIHESEERVGSKRRRVRKRHITEVPCLLDELREAMKPASSEDASAAGFESRPSAELEPIAVYTLIETQSRTYANALGVNRPTLVGRLHGLVGATHTDTQLANLVKEARTWVWRAKLATGWETRPFTLNQPCPYCWAKNALTITGDLEKARCARCRSEWDEQTIGLLGSMLTANQEAETWVTVRCDSLHAGRSCQRAAGHLYEHRDSVGRYWYEGPDGTTYVETRSA